ncbi:MAG: 16S rRNA (cytidine(1402)-2'-O)-methyltransferase [Candidatus Pacebacteria bacterium]|nr:16S rRNA (cytidine(1402)-2'-O)-methyltransferase [Candidatus Paceibacterota bacterium]MCD8508274.1 16S rRNA (cytidine(1402)-2'-O)-methyltransferase [Candidatus Paceibacterota bacterium]MCD8528231.1 16S rRNA (cytidine(1402)-2'-O)-methyltransferase [Candidatus Paceibacterota bacterium]MCD8564002.1 16S rRNA (cytidine(1402)-2'-O)-methyltransferase [Candidatus Paceibacterota bacterium]
MSTLYIVATPIGNLEDITFRAVRILNEVDIILCEDTRTTKKLLEAHAISYKKLVSYHAHSQDARHQEILTWLKEGMNIALVSDAGTPTISDPGVKLVQLIYTELPDVTISPIPGASALMSALSMSGISSAQFVFYGFLPHKKGRAKIFQDMADQEHTCVCYESPHRLMKTLEAFTTYLPPEKTVVVVREITKIYEQAVRGSAQEVYTHFQNHPDTVRGECVIVVGV